MPVFTAALPQGRFTPAQKQALADALVQSLVQALNLDDGDRFISVTEHGKDELFLHPTYMGMTRTENAMIITVLLGPHHQLEAKRRLAMKVNELVVEALGVSPDDIFFAIIPVPKENFSFGRGELQLAEG
ncbi:tautomerase family protein [Catellatospora sp. NPDC049111]|uniref:tautomerase family protein n=1 Tax=unclassified Catellatospora TaxID=2645785 RepID=UPI003404B219